MSFDHRAIFIAGHPDQLADKFDRDIGNPIVE